jgi:hypothetical protein
MHAPRDQHEPDVAEHDQDWQADLERERSYRELLKVNRYGELHRRKLYRAVLLAVFNRYDASRLAAAVKPVRRRIMRLAFDAGRSLYATDCQGSLRCLTSVVGAWFPENEGRQVDVGSSNRSTASQARTNAAPVVECTDASHGRQLNRRTALPVANEGVDLGG